MSGGGKKKSTAAAPDTSTTQPTTTVQPAMPGQLNMLAEQLSAGGYGAVPDILTMMNQYYAPMQVPDYSAAPVPAADPKTDKTPQSPLNDLLGKQTRTWGADR